MSSSSQVTPPAVPPPVDQAPNQKVISFTPKMLAAIVTGQLVLFVLFGWWMASDESNTGVVDDELFVSSLAPLKTRLTATPEGLKVWQQERVILELTELICEIMEGKGVSRAELAKMLGKTKGYISQMLDGTTNFTVRTISDVFTVLGYELVAGVERLESEETRRSFRFIETESVSWSTDKWPTEPAQFP